MEFLLDNATGEFYFLEMNTRLQVEHPVTEEVVRVRDERVDLVELQLRVATGEALGVAQDDITLEGHAIEARVYAEDSFNGFLPQAGTASYWWPTEIYRDGVEPTHDDSGAVTGRLRIDHALESGQVVSTSFDPMLGKVIAWGSDREAARRRLVEGLERVDVLGLTTNTGFLVALAASDEFRDATIDTAWLDHHEVPAPTDEVARLLGAHALAPRPSGTSDPWRHDGWRSAADPAPVVVDLGGPMTLTPTEASVQVVDSAQAGPIRWVHAHVAGQGQGATVRDTSSSVEVLHRGQRFVFDRHDPFADHGPAAGDGTLLAPMPGTVLAVNVAEGQTVVEGETLGVMEAMKMELALKAPFAGTVTTVGAATGDLVKLGAVLFAVEETT